ncbi:amidohydrolase family protein [Candidatus Nitrosarchaeum limnium BG20]|uniref:Amidohydrolase family protein n=2 Tax=Nitrosarchaeum TaxID=1007082 RepID=S2ENN6_9ARCH|nr:amidohydrolase family protein [Candidatus Nitrosarchaeum limnium BG20]
MQNIPLLDDRIAELQKEMISNNVDYAVILSSYKTNSERPSAKQILDAIKKYDNLGVVAGFSIDNHTDEDLKNFRTWIKDGLVKGLKIYSGYEHYYPYDERYQKVYDICVEFGVPAMFHTGDTYSPKGKLRYARPLNLDEVAVDNPELKIVLCHLGNPWIQDAQEVIYKNKNVYADISGLVIGSFDHFFEKMIKEKVAELINYAGEPKYLLYGTDWPISTMDSYLSFVAKLNIKKEFRDKFMYQNAKDLFKIS